MLRLATVSDVPAIAAIYNDAVLNTTAIWNDSPVSVENRVTWLSERTSAGFPVIVAVDDRDETIGYGTFGNWRAFDGYRHTVEHSVYVRADQRGNGIGPLILSELIEHARRLDKHVMIAAIEAGNQASIRLHEKLGFVNRGTLPQVGTKFGAWLDLTFMQLTLDDA